MKVVNDFLDYEIIDSGSGMKYERWGNIYLLRPDPLVMWEKNIKLDKLDAIYHRSNKGGGYWESFKNLSTFKVSYKDLKFNLKQNYNLNHLSFEKLIFLHQKHLLYNKLRRHL